MAIVGDINGSPSNYDDAHYALTLPFPVSCSGQSSENIQLSINGFISVVGVPDASYTNSQLPVAVGFVGNDGIGQQVGEYSLPDTSVCALWDDLYIYVGTQQGIYYQIDGAVGTRQLVFEFYTSAYSNATYDRHTEYYHFTMTYLENVPGVVTFQYHQVSFNGKSATVGTQSRIANQFKQFSFNDPAIMPGMKLTFDTHTNTVVKGTFPM